MKTTIKVTLVCICLLFFAACKKDGTGGKSTIKGSVAHHGKKIPGAIVYIKYGATEFPGADVSKYDSHVTADLAGAYEIGSLLKGNYYVYAVGYDADISENVFGGIAVTLKRKQTAIVDIPVVE